MKKSIILIFLFTLFQASWALAQEANTALVSGMLYRSDTREPIQTKLFFVDNSGETINTQSEINGQYSINLPLGKEYMLVTEGYSTLIDDTCFIIPKKNDSQQLVVNVEVSSISKGDVICTANAFNSNSNVINASGLHQLLKMKQFLKANSKVKLDIYISAEDTYFNPKKHKKGHTLEELLEKRASTLRDVLTSMRIDEQSYQISTVAAAATEPIKPVRKSRKKGKVAPAEKSNIITMKVEIAKVSKL